MENAEALHEVRLLSLQHALVLMLSKGLNNTLNSENQAQILSGKTINPWDAMNLKK